jgi:hypothetical protein
LVELIGRLTVAKKSKKTKRGAPTRKKKGMKKTRQAKTRIVAKKPEPRPAPITLAPAPLLGGFGGKAEDQ